MIRVQCRVLRRVGGLILIAALLLSPGAVWSQIRSNFGSSITSESMAAVWIAKDQLGLFKKYGLDVQYILMPRSPLAVAALVARRDRHGGDRAWTFGKRQLPAVPM